jgi:predicted nucleic acid-binding protein
MILVDSSVWIDFFNQRLTPETNWMHASHGIEDIGITTLVLAEVLQGIRHDSRFRSTERFFGSVTILDSPTRRVAVQSALNYRVLRNFGITVRGTIDCLLATLCIEEGHTLLHHDADFDPFERYLGLDVLHPGSPAPIK